MGGGWCATPADSQKTCVLSTFYDHDLPGGYIYPVIFLAPKPGGLSNPGPRPIQTTALRSGGRLTCPQPGSIETAASKTRWTRKFTAASNRDSRFEKALNSQVHGHVQRRPLEKHGGLVSPRPRPIKTATSKPRRTRKSTTASSRYGHLKNTADSPVHSRVQSRRPF